MKANESIQSEDRKLLTEIVNLKSKISELYQQTGPASSDYITLSIKLDLLLNKYIDEKIESLIWLEKIAVNGESARGPWGRICRHF